MREVKVEAGHVRWQQIFLCKLFAPKRSCTPFSDAQTPKIFTSLFTLLPKALTGKAPLMFLLELFPICSLVIQHTVQYINTSIIFKSMYLSVYAEVEIKRIQRPTYYIQSLIVLEMTHNVSSGTYSDIRTLTTSTPGITVTLCTLKY